MKPFKQAPKREFRTPSGLLNVMIEAVFAAGARLVRDFGEVEKLQITSKGPLDFVSSADRRSQNTIHQILSRARPGYQFMMEETAPPIHKFSSEQIEKYPQRHNKQNAAPNAEDAKNDIETMNDERREDPQKPSAFTWIVDPLDGTYNFLHGVPHFSISIALARHNEVIAGVTYHPILDELFWAEKGLGAYLNNTRIAVSKRDHLESALTGIAMPAACASSTLNRVLKVTQKHLHKTRHMGCASLDLAYVASGRFDACIGVGLGFWDIAAGVILVQEAGGIATDIHNQPITRHLAHGIMASNMTLHQKFTHAFAAT